MTLIGRVLADRYEIIEEIGSGGMAVVYKAKCKLLNRFVAVKVLRPDLQNDDEFVRRFNVEAQAAASLTHPNIVSIFDVGNEDGLHYIVMEYVEGKTLKEYIDERHILPWREAVDYAVQVAKGLEQAHKNSIVHRDIKPHNIIMKNDGVMKVTDFGIARANVQSTMTCEDTAIGSVHYISPEQARGGYTDERSDIYSLGVVLYEMLTGTVPFNSERPVTVAIMHLQDEPVPLRDINLSIPLPLERIVLKAMTKEVSLRYKNISEMIEELESVLHDPERYIEKADSLKDAETDIGATRVMPAVNIEKAKDTPEEENVEAIPVTRDSSVVVGERSHDSVSKTRPTKSEVEEMDAKKERKTIALAVISAVLFLAIIIFGAWTLFGNMISGQTTVEVPKVEGRIYDEVKEKYDSENENIEEGGIKIHIVKEKEENNVEPEGTILKQTPGAGEKTKVKDGTLIINVVVSKGNADITLGNYVRSDEKRAKDDLEKLGLDVIIVEEFSDDIPKGSVIKNKPEAGEKVRKGDSVTLYVSQGPETANEDTPSGEPSNGGTVSNNENPQSGTQSGEKKSTFITIYGPKNSESALVQVNVNGVKVHSKTLAKGSSDLVKIMGATDTVEVEIFHDGVSQGKNTVKLH